MKQLTNWVSVSHRESPFVLPHFRQVQQEHWAMWSSMWLRRIFAQSEQERESKEPVLGRMTEDLSQARTGAEPTGLRQMRQLLTWRLVLR
jgi:hypothetical protein